MTKRRCWNEMLYGWNLVDGGFEQYPMPEKWRHKYQAAQIIDSREKEGILDAPVYGDVPWPTDEQKYQGTVASEMLRKDVDPQHKDG